MMRDWHDMTPNEVLDSHPVLNLSQAAYVLARFKRDGTPDRRQVVDLLKKGKLRLVDPDPRLSPTKWTIAASNVRKYIDGKSDLTVRGAA